MRKATIVELEAEADQLRDANVLVLEMVEQASLLMRANSHVGVFL